MNIKTLEVNKLTFSEQFPDLDEVSDKLDRLDAAIRVGELNWKDFPGRPEVKASMAYTDEEILLKYFVTENWFKAEMTQPDQPVYEDSCVEFFVSPADDGVYYNFEFNGIGTCLFGCGRGRENRVRAEPEIISGIRRKSSAGKEVIREREGEFSWQLTIAISKGVFFLHLIEGFEGKEFRANFYKCGDRLAVPHYLTWSPVKTDKPDFHRPEFFGVVRFV